MVIKKYWHTGPLRTVQLITRGMQTFISMLLINSAELLQWAWVFHFPINFYEKNSSTLNTTYSQQSQIQSNTDWNEKEFGLEFITYPVF